MSPLKLPSRESCSPSLPACHQHRGHLHAGWRNAVGPGVEAQVEVEVESGGSGGISGRLLFQFAPSIIRKFARDEKPKRVAARAK